MKNRKLTQKGFTLVELLLVIGVISALTGASLYFYKKREQFTLSLNQVKMITAFDKSLQNFASVINNNTNLNTINNDNIIKAKLVPPQNIRDNQLVNSYGGNMTVTSRMVGTTPAYTLVLEAIPSIACVNLSNTLGPDSLAVTANGGIIKALGATTEIDVANVASFCSEQLNTLELVRAILKTPRVVTDNSNGNNGDPNSLLVADLHQTAIGVSCPSNTIATGYGCGCPEATLWDGQKCDPITSKNRLDGTTLGSGIPATNATGEDLQNGVIVGTPAVYNAQLGKHLPAYINLPASAPGKEGFIITEKSPDSVAGSSFCTNGQVLKQTGSGSAVTRQCVTPVFNYDNASGAQNQVIDTVNDTNKYKHCLLGEIDGLRCKMPPSTTTNTPKTIWQSKVQMPVSNFGANCSNGQVWNKNTQTCGCVAGTVLNANGYCGCPEGQQYNGTSGVCEVK